LGLILHEVEVGDAIVDVRAEDGTVVAIASALTPRFGDEVIECQGGALISGLRDHHLHVLALARASDSVAVGPREAPTRSAFATKLRAAAMGGEVRAIGYHERVFGALDRDTLDAVIRDVPVRVQHRSGGLWILVRARRARSRPTARRALRAR
jgi:dihydroorotase-like cyclic amidohydrolase